MTGLQWVSTVRKAPRRPRAGGRAAADPIAERKAFLEFNQVSSSCAVTGTLTLSFSPRTHPNTHTRTHSMTNTIHALPRASTSILPPTPHMANHRMEQDQPLRERPPPATNGTPLAFYPARAASAGNHTAAGTGSHPVRDASAGNLPVRGPPYAAYGPFPGPPRSALAPQVGETTALGRSPDWVAATGQAVVGEGTRPVRPDPYAVSPPTAVTSFPPLGSEPECAPSGTCYPGRT